MTNTRWLTRPSARALYLACLALLLAASAAQARLRIFGKSDEVSMGRDTVKQVEKEYKVWNDPQATARVNRIGRELVAAQKGRGFTYTFKALDTKEVNAFAVPGGWVYVTRGLLELPGLSDSELAFIMGHEITHVENRHSMNQLESQLGVSVALQILLGGKAGGLAPQLAQGVMANRYSRKDEGDADQGGVTRMIKAKYDPVASISALKRLKTLQKGKGAGKTTLFDSHPDLDRRIARIKERLRKDGYTVPLGRTAVRPNSRIGQVG